jgi:phage terminase large subunit GpA-like protein
MMQPALTADIFAQPLPDFFPESLRRACAGKQIRYTLPRAVRERMQVPEDLTVSQWAEKHRRVTEIDAQPGRWRQDLVPHTKKLMDFISLPWVREVWLCMVERAGKTQVLLNAAMWQIDRGIDSGNVFWLMPSENEAKKALGERIIPALKASPRTARLLSRYADDTSRSLVRCNHGPRLIPAWSNSPASLSSFYGKLRIGDEIDKNADRSGGETDSITLLKKRGRDSDDSKLLLASTPAGKFIYKGMLAAQQVWAYHSRCPHCREFVLMDAEHFVIPEGATVESVKHGEHSVVYACNACRVEWDEADRAEAYQAGDFVAIKGADVERPESIGAHMPAFPLPNIKMAEIGAAIVRARSGDLAALMDLAHGYKAINYTPETKDRQEDTILLLRDDRPTGVVPTWTDALEISIDTQDNGFWYRIRAWRYGIDLKSALVKAGYVPSACASDFTSLDALIAAEYPDENGEPHRIMAGIIDSAGHRTGEVYAWCRTSGVLPAKGAQGRKTQPVTVSRIDRYPGNNKPIPGGLNLYHIDTHYHKDQIANKLQIDQTDNGALVLHSGYTHDQLKALARDPASPQHHNLEDYARQMCVEYRDERNLWQCPAGKANHVWDCESNGLALVQYLGWAYAVSTKNEPVIAPQRRVYSRGANRD